MFEMSSGYLKIDSEADRLTVASILFNNGYTVSKARYKKNGKAYAYYVKFEPTPADVARGGEQVDN